MSNAIFRKLFVGELTPFTAAEMLEIRGPPLPAEWKEEEELQRAPRSPPFEMVLFPNSYVTPARRPSRKGVNDAPKKKMYHLSF